jgi:hypothetical protein
MVRQELVCHAQAVRMLTLVQIHVWLVIDHVEHVQDLHLAAFHVTRLALYQGHNARATVDPKTPTETV